ncbi:MAG: hypothetical protein ACP5VN_01470 [Acidobacteriota bacterium]
MGQKFPLSVAEKQKILYLGGASPELRRSWGERYEQAGLLHDALEFFAAAQDRGALERIAGKAVEEADLLLLQNVFRALGEPLPPDLLLRLEGRGRELGKAADAQRAALLRVPAENPKPR